MGQPVRCKTEQKVHITYDPKAAAELKSGPRRRVPAFTYRQGLG